MGSKLQCRLQRGRQRSRQINHQAPIGGLDFMPLLKQWSAALAGGASVASTFLLAMASGSAMAAELSPWYYDAQTRSLTLTLPNDVSPSISVIAPDQLLVELPNTQIGQLTGQSVNDGVIESIALEQATPETAWLILDFAPGTVLAAAQQATLLESGGNSAQADEASNQWQVRPALMASSRSSEPTAMADTRMADTRMADATVGSAAELQVPPSNAGSSSATMAQISEDGLPQLPILEPAVPLEAPIVVPPLTAINRSGPSTPPPVAAAPTAEPLQAVVPSITIPIILESDAEEAADVAEGSSRDRAETASDAVEADEMTAEAPSAPPFIGEVADIENIEITDAPVIETAAIERDAVESDAVESDASGSDAVESDADESELAESDADESDFESAEEPQADREPEIAVVVPPVSLDELPDIEAAPTAPPARRSEALANSETLPPASRPPVSDSDASAAPVIQTLPIQPVAQEPTNRWPEPITFGQPLP
jgi:hypothetical protein